MKHISSIITVLSGAAFLASCASAPVPQAVTAAVPAVQAAAAIETEYREIRSWKLKTVETAYPDGSISGSVLYSYDPEGNLLSEEERNAKGQTVSRKEYLRPEPGRLETVTRDGNGTIIGKTVSTLSGDLVTNQVTTGSKGEVQSMEDFRYDGAGRKTGWVVRTASGSSISTEYFWQDGRIGLVLVKDSGGSLIKSFERSYAEDGTLAAEAEFTASHGSVSRTVYVSEGGFPVREEKRSATGAVLSRIVYANDPEGNVTGISYQDRNGRELQSKKQTWQVFTTRVRVK